MAVGAGQVEDISLGAYRESFQRFLQVSGFIGAGGGSRTRTGVATRQILSLGEHQVKSYEKLTTPWGLAGFHQTK